MTDGIKRIKSLFGVTAARWNLSQAIGGVLSAQAGQSANRISLSGSAMFKAYSISKSVESP